MLMKFKVLSGKHELTAVGQDGKPLPSIIYVKGNVFQTDRDVAKRFNRRGCIMFKQVPNDTPVTPLSKLEFAKVPEPQPEELDRPTEEELLEAEHQAEVLEEEVKLEEEERQASKPDLSEVEDVLSGLTKAELIEKAEEMEIDITGLTTKRDILARVRSEFV